MRSIIILAAVLIFSFALKAQSPLSHRSLPLNELRISSLFGIRVHPISGKQNMHEGIDLKAKSDSVRSILAGKVIAIKYHKSLGIYVTVSHNKSLASVYGHLSYVLVLPNDSVRAGYPIGVTGSTGKTTGEHLHFEVHWKGRPVNPLKFLYDLPMLSKAHEI